METIRINRADAGAWLTGQIDAGREVHNAPRPLLGTPAPGFFAGAQGSLSDVNPRHGLFFFALDTADAYFERFRENNERMDARRVVLVTDDEVRAAWEASCKERGIEPADVEDIYDGDWKAAARSVGLVPSRGAR
jgi:hypothetical protein